MIKQILHDKLMEEPKYFLLVALQTWDKGQCWIWPFSKSTEGYARINSIAGSSCVSHLVLGERPIGMIALHSCDTPSCFNPRHLRWGTHQDNADDKMSRGRSSVLKGEKNGNAKLRDIDLLYIYCLHDLGHNNKDIATEFNVSGARIGQILKKR